MPNLNPSLLPDPLRVKAEIILDMQYYCEGPAIDMDGRLFFTDIAGQSIKYFKDGKDFIWSKGRRPNGQAITKNGYHFVCDSQLGAVLNYDGNGKLLRKASPTFIEGIPVRCPNDIVLDTEGGFYFTDSIRYQGAVYHVDKNGKSTSLAQNIDFANGIAHDRERNVLYVAESYKNRILKLNLDKRESDEAFLSVFADLPRNQIDPCTGNLPDGLKLDDEGRLWVAHYGMQALQVLSRNGQLLATYNTEIPLTSNLCFMGEEIWITGGMQEPGPGRLSKIKVGVKGYPLM
jgi:gluconolactonase